MANRLQDERAEPRVPASRRSSSISTAGCAAAYAPNSARVMPCSTAMALNTWPPGTSSSANAPATRVAAVVVPDPGGPETVISKDGAGSDGSGSEGSAAEGLEQRLALLLAQAAHATGVGDADLFHGPARTHLANTGKRLEDR